MTCCWGREGPIYAIWDKCSPKKHHLDTNMKFEFLLKGKMVGWYNQMLGCTQTTWEIFKGDSPQSKLVPSLALVGLSGACSDR